MRIEADMNDEDIQKFFNSYVRQANPTAVCNRIFRALQAHLKDSNLNSEDPEVKLLHMFCITMSAAYGDMSELEERLLGIPSDVPKTPLL